MMRINEIIKEKRLEKGYTQEQMAELLGITAPAVNKWEKGASYPDITLLSPLARLLGVDLNTLLSFHEDLSKKEVQLFVSHLSKVAEEDGFEAAYREAYEKDVYKRQSLWSKWYSRTWKTAGKDTWFPDNKCCVAKRKAFAAVRRVCESNKCGWHLV